MKIFEVKITGDKTVPQHVFVAAEDIIQAESLIKNNVLYSDYSIKEIDISAQGIIYEQEMNL